MQALWGGAGGDLTPLFVALPSWLHLCSGREGLEHPCVLVSNSPGLQGREERASSYVQTVPQLHAAPWPGKAGETWAGLNGEIP